MFETSRMPRCVCSFGVSLGLTSHLRLLSLYTRTHASAVIGSVRRGSGLGSSSCISFPLGVLPLGSSISLWLNMACPGFAWTQRGLNEQIKLNLRSLLGLKRR